MKIGVCGIACEICPRMVQKLCPNGEKGCTPSENKFCQVCTCAFKKGVRYCFECSEFPCAITKNGPISLAIVNTSQGRMFETYSKSKER